MAVTETEKTSGPRLPTLADLPDADVLIYDGKCGFCTNQVRRLASWDRGRRLVFVSLHDQAVADRYPDLSHEQLMRQMYIVDQAGNRHGGAAALRYLSRRLPLLWPLAPLMHIPLLLPVWQWLYRQVARRRYRLSKSSQCDDGACELHFGQRD